MTISGLPFTSGTANAVFPVAWHNATSSFIGVPAAASSYTAAAGTTLLHATNGSRLRINGTYEASA